MRSQAATSPPTLAGDSERRRPATTLPIELRIADCGLRIDWKIAWVDCASAGRYNSTMRNDDSQNESAIRNPQSAIKTVGVLGCGLMGSGIAQVCAASGDRTICRDVDD